MYREFTDCRTGVERSTPSNEGYSPHENFTLSSPAVRLSHWDSHFACCICIHGVSGADSVHAFHDIHFRSNACAVLLGIVHFMGGRRGTSSWMASAVSVK
jgi:hypothetical protein